MSTPIPFAETEAAILTAAGWTPESDDPIHHEVSELAYQIFWGMGGFPCECCNFGVEAILTKYDDGTIVGSFTLSDKPPWVITTTVEHALEVYKTAEYH